MHPVLLTSKQSGQSYQDIQDHHLEVAFPISEPNVDTDELTSLSTVTPIYKKVIFKILLDTPLLERTNHLAYQLHPVPVPQPSQEITPEKHTFDQVFLISLWKNRRELIFWWTVKMLRHLRNCQLIRPAKEAYKNKHMLASNDNIVVKIFAWKILKLTKEFTNIELKTAEVYFPIFCSEH